MILIRELLPQIKISKMLEIELTKFKVGKSHRNPQNQERTQIVIVVQEEAEGRSLKNTEASQERGIGVKTKRRDPQEVGIEVRAKIGKKAVESIRRIKRRKSIRKIGRGVRSPLRGKTREKCKPDWQKQE